METLYYRKIAQIAHRDGPDELRALAAAASHRATMPTIKATDRRKLRAWFCRWLSQDFRGGVAS
jgi:hypothetical protein